MRASHSRLSEAERITPIWCQVSGMAWQKACTAPSVLGEKRALETKSTPEVPIETKAVPGRDDADAAGGRGVVAGAAGDHDRPVDAPAPGELGQELAGGGAALDEARHVRARMRPVASSRSSDQSRAPTSSQKVPEASDISETWWPVSRRRT